MGAFHFSARVEEKICHLPYATVNELLELGCELTISARPRQVFDVRRVNMFEEGLFRSRAVCRGALNAKFALGTLKKT